MLAWHGTPMAAWVASSVRYPCSRLSSGELDVSAERYPADSVTGTPAGERCDGTAKEELELFDAHPEDACEEEVSEFVYDYQQRKAEYELQYLDKYIHKRFVLLSGAGPLAVGPSLPLR